MESKTCANPNCRKEFAPFKNRRYCFSCGGSLSAAKRYRDANKEKEAARCKRYRDANKEKQVAYKRKYFQMNKERRAAWSKRYRDANKEKEAARRKRYREKENPARRLRDYKKSARRRGYEWSLSDAEALKLFYEPCFYCGDPGGGIDRFDNSQGYTAENSVPCCKTHNFMKGTMNGEEFIAQAMKITRHTVGVVELFLSRKDVSNVQG